MLEHIRPLTASERHVTRCYRPLKCVWGSAFAQAHDTTSDGPHRNVVYVKTVIALRSSDSLQWSMPRNASECMGIYDMERCDWLCTHMHFTYGLVVIWALRSTDLSLGSAVYRVRPVDRMHSTGAASNACRKHSSMSSCVVTAKVVILNHPKISLTRARVQGHRPPWR
jgi:hypothetical protein